MKLFDREEQFHGFYFFVQKNLTYFLITQKKFIKKDKKALTFHKNII
jgi:hypothetical protein